MSKSVLPVVKCAPKIWNKLSAAQQALWVELRNIFINEMIVLNQIRSKKPLIIEGDFEVVAHNLALEAVWELARQGIMEDRKPAHNTGMLANAQICQNIVEDQLDYLICIGLDFKEGEHDTVRDNLYRIVAGKLQHT